MALPDHAVAFGYGLVPSADCEALSQSAGAKVRQMTKGDAGILEEQTNFWLPKVEPVIRDRGLAQGPCLS